MSRLLPFVLLLTVFCTVSFGAPETPATDGVKRGFKTGKETAPSEEASEAEKQPESQDSLEREAAGPGAPPSSISGAAAEGPLVEEESLEQPASPSEFVEDGEDPAEPVLEVEMLAVEPTLSHSLKHLSFGGFLQFRALASQPWADMDSTKRLTAQLHTAALDFLGDLNDRSGFHITPFFQADGRRLGLERAYLFYHLADHAQVRAGIMKRPFSMEAILSERHIITVGKGRLYHDFLESRTGYAGEDLGLVLNGSYIRQMGTYLLPLSYELGVFNGKQNLDPNDDYSGQQYEGVDDGFKSKDAAARLAVSVWDGIDLEGAVSVKTAEDRLLANNYDVEFALGYEAGFDMRAGPYNLLGEIAWGDNPQGLDTKLMAEQAKFFAFYGMGVYRAEYGADRASETWIKVEGLDPDWRKRSPNDGRLLYTAGVNFFPSLTQSLQAAYSVLQPITQVENEGDLEHTVLAQWRMVF